MLKINKEISNNSKYDNLLSGKSLKNSDSNSVIFQMYKKLSIEQKNEFFINILQHNLSDQRFLLYGWPVQQLYSKYATKYIKNKSDLKILEVGPGDNLMTSALWILEKRVSKITLLDKYQSSYFLSAKYHKGLIDLIKSIKFLPREGFNNYYPFDESF